MYDEGKIDHKPRNLISKTVKHQEFESLELLGDVYDFAEGGTIYSVNLLTQTKTPVGNTVLHLAVWNGNNDVVDKIVKRAPKLLFEVNSNKDTVLHVAARAGHSHTVKKLLELYTNCKRSEIPSEWIKYTDLEEDIEVEDYLENISIDGLLRLFMKMKNNQNNIMLHEAMMSSSSSAKKILKVLEEYKTPGFNEPWLSHSCYNEFALHDVNNAMQSAVYLAVEAGYKETVELILEKCSQIARPKGLSPLVAAIMKRDEDMLLVILRKRQKWIHLKDENERIPLHFAASIGYREGVVRLWEKCKTCSLQKDKYGYLPIHLASDGGHVEVVKQLLKCCPDPSEMLDNSGRNIFHIAAKSGKYEVVRYILDTNELRIKMMYQKDNNGDTPLHLATRGCHPKTVYALTLQERVEDLALVNIDNETVLDIVHEKFLSQNGKPTLEQLLTWTALKSAGAKSSSSEFSPFYNLKPNEQIVEMKEGSTEPYKDRVETLILVALITASVGACLSQPGGAQGAVNNRHHPMFKFFIFSITVSLFSSISATIILIWARLGLIQLLGYALKLAMPLLGVALTSLFLAFMAGFYSVISTISWLATTFLVLTVIFVVMVVLLHILLYLPSLSTSKPLRYISYYPFMFLASLIQPETHHNLKW